MNLRTYINSIALIFLALPVFALPSVDSIKPKDELLKSAMPGSKAGELTIASFNVRNFGQRSRSVRDILHLVDLVDEADVVLFQEVGLGLLRSDNEYNTRTLNTLVGALAGAFGDEWSVLLSDSPSGSGAGRETSILAHRNALHGNRVSASFIENADLGQSRDLFVWQITRKNHNILIGSVHLTPDDPERGHEMIKLAEWMAHNSANHVVVLGDMNWGYKKTSGVENYRGEKALSALDTNGQYTQVFRDISYLGKGSSDDFRTNLSVRKSAFFYDQIFLSDSLPLAQGGKLLEDVGFISLSHQGSYFEKQQEKSQKRRRYGLTKLKSNTAVDYTQPKVKQTVDAAMKATISPSINDASWIVSDHRPVWATFILPDNADHQ